MVNEQDGNETVVAFTVDELAQEIRRVDGRHDLGAGALAEALMPFIERHPDPRIAKLEAENARLREAVENERRRCFRAVAKQVAPWVKKKEGEYWDGYREAIDDALEDIDREAADTRAQTGGSE